MDQRDPNAPAFPTNAIRSSGFEGLSKREIMAAMVMQKLSFVCTGAGILAGVKHSVKVADALLTELSRETVAESIDAIRDAFLSDPDHDNDTINWALGIIDGELSVAAITD